MPNPLYCPQPIAPLSRPASALYAEHIPNSAESPPEKSPLSTAKRLSRANFSWASPGRPAPLTTGGSRSGFPCSTIAAGARGFRAGNLWRSITGAARIKHGPLPRHSEQSRRACCHKKCLSSRAVLVVQASVATRRRHPDGTSCHEATVVPAETVLLILPSKEEMVREGAVDEGSRWRRDSFGKTKGESKRERGPDRSGSGRGGAGARRKGWMTHPV